MGTGVSWADSTRAKYEDCFKTVGEKIQKNSGAAKWHHIFISYPATSLETKHIQTAPAAIAFNCGEHGWCLLIVYSVAPYPWLPCSVKSSKTWLHHLPESLAFVLFYMSLNPCQRSWEKLCACHFLFSHTKDGRAPNFCGMTVNHGGTSLQLWYPLEMKRSENKGVVK